MNTKEKQILTAFLSKTVKMDEEGASSLFNEDGELITLAPAIEADSARMLQKKEEAQKEYDKGFRKSMEKLERSLREEFGVDSEETGLELIKSIIAEKTTKAPIEKDVDIEAHPKFIEARTQLEKKHKQALKDFEDKMHQVELNYHREKLLSEVNNIALSEFEKLNPVLPDDPKKAQAWKNVFLNEFSQNDYEKSGESIVIKKDGKPLEDEHGNMISFAEYVKRKAENYFTFKQAGERSASGNGEAQHNSITFKDRGDYITKLKSAKDETERKALIEAYNAKK